jgi:hypothetical protein
MTNLDKYNKQFNLIEGKFKKGGCKKEATLSFIYNNIDFLENNNQSLENIHFIYNHDDLYGILITNGNTYSWSIYNDNTFYPLRTNTNNNSQLDSGDYIIEMIINFTNKDIVEIIFPNIKKMNLSTKIKALKQIKLNSNGFHIR